MKRLLAPLLSLLLLAAVSPAQSVALVDSDIQLRPTAWRMHNPTDGSAIGGVMPLNYGLLHEVPGYPRAMQLYVEGPSWSTMMGYTQRGLYSNTPDYIKLDFDVYIIDPNGALLETDLVPTVPIPNTSPQKFTQFNMSLQLNYSTGMLQDVNSSGPWIDIAGAKPGRLSVGKHHYTITGAWNLAANTYGLTSVSIDGTTYLVTQNSVGKVSTWSPGITIQFQITAAPTTSTWTSTSALIDAVVLQEVSK